MLSNDSDARSTLPIEDGVLATWRSAIDDGSPLIVELRLASGAEPPERQIFHRYDMLVAYLRTIARPGDRISTWRYDMACRSDNMLVGPLELRSSPA